MNVLKLKGKTMSSQYASELKLHAFICTTCQHRDQNGRLSNPEEAIELRSRVKKWAQEKFGKEKVRINSSGCLGQCEQGITCAIYPQNVWLTNLNHCDDQIIQNKIDELMKIKF